MRPLFLEVFDSPVFGVIVFLLFFALASLVAGMGWLIIHLCKLLGQRWSQPAETDPFPATTRRLAALLLLVPIGFLVVAIGLVVNKAAFFWAGLSR
ncbi:hypothetical protein [Hymenobacter cheonanensis]|uniref:hypothetical protein n=1 Tax=Hymenobacter sp. CA2-7 TaxID=3063993 RepID=UPI0027141EA9|nr:hypothetical protein [Hymenobacter sp. CA2-7]MDO7886131.1 hypothetical protein [Hymenobacter sp. CA2-7]